MSQIRINIYTDSPNLFQGYLGQMDVEFHVLTPDFMIEMLGSSDYIHRRKIAVIDETFKRYPNENILFVDSDTFFTANILGILENIRLGQSYMHLREYTFENGLNLFASFDQAKEPSDFIGFIESGPLMIAGNPEQITKNNYCWNSGVLGLHKTISSSMPDVFNLSDAFYKHSKWFISEQLAFSIVLDKVSSIRPADQYVVHYWGKRQKKLIDDLLLKRPDWLVQNNADTAKFRSLTRQLKKIVTNDILKEKAVIALSNKSWLYGLKRTLYAITKDLSNISLFRELWGSWFKKN